MLTKKRILLALAGATLASTLTGCTQYTDPSMVSLRYAGGPTEGGKFKECVEPGNKQVSNDSYYPYPTTQRENVWDTENFERGSNSADHADLQVIDEAGQVATVRVKVSFYLNTDCDVLREFHEKIGRTRQAYFNTDGTYGDGWIWAMDNYISSAVTDRAKAAATKYTVEEMWLKPDVRDAMAAAIEEDLQKAVDAGMEGDEQFYKNFSVRIFGAAPEAEFLALYKERKAALVKADTAEANKRAKIAEAQADAAVAREKAKVRQAEIDGYGDVNAFIKAQMVEKGLNPYQPTYGGVVAAPGN